MLNTNELTYEDVLILNKRDYSNCESYLDHLGFEKPKSDKDDLIWKISSKKLVDLNFTSRSLENPRELIDKLLSINADWISFHVFDPSICDIFKLDKDFLYVVSKIYDYELFKFKYDLSR